VLLAIGAAIVVLVFAYNKWQERRLRRQGEAAFGSRHDDALFGTSAPATERIEPVLGAAPESPAPEPVGGFAPEPQAGPEAAAAPHVAEAMPESGPEPVAEGAPPLDGGVDWVAVLSPAAGERIDPAPLLGADWSAFTKVVTLLGEAAGSWAALQDGAACDRILAGLQLADRKGAVAATEISAMAALLGGIAAANGWQVKHEDLESAARRALELDRFCAEVDVQILLEVIAAGDKPFLGTKIRGLAESNGLSLTDGGAFVRTDDAGAQLFTLRNRGATPFSAEHMREFSTRALTLALDVPRAPRGAYQAMRGFAAALCDALQGSVVDEQGRKLDAGAMDRVATQLAAIDARLAGFGVEPGGATALRLFS
jgi:hypothetical protein